MQPNYMEQSFAALSSRDKMRFLRWAAESVGAKLNTVFGDPSVDDVLDAQADAKLQQNEEDAQLEIPGFLKRKK